MAGRARPGKARRGVARQGKAGRGWARLGKDVKPLGEAKIPRAFHFPSSVVFFFGVGLFCKVCCLAQEPGSHVGSVL